MPDDPNWYNTGGASGAPVVMAPYYVSDTPASTPAYNGAGSGLGSLFSSIGGFLNNALGAVGEGLAKKANEKLTDAVYGSERPGADQYANPTANNGQTTAASNPTVIAGVDNKTLLIGGAVAVFGFGALIYLAARK